MLVVGGRTRWVRAVSCTGGLAAALLIGPAGCGGRTLDQEAYLGDGSMPSAGQSNGGASGQGGAPIKGGSPSSPTAGSTSTPTAGQPNAPSDSVVKTCKSYCSGYAATCPAQLMGQNCEQACRQEMTGFGERCQGLGLKALKCLTPFFKKDAPSCEIAVSGALTQCGAQVERFQNCKGVNQPKPNLPQSPEPGSCPSVSEGGQNSCRTIYSCMSGAYTVSCDYSGPGADPNGPSYNCVCSGPTGGQGMTLAAPTAPCATAAQLCGFTNGPTLK